MPINIRRGLCGNYYFVDEPFAVYPPDTTVGEISPRHREALSRAISGQGYPPEYYAHCGYHQQQIKARVHRGATPAEEVNTFLEMAAKDPLSMIAFKAALPVQEYYTPTYHPPRPSMGDNTTPSAPPIIEIESNTSTLGAFVSLLLTQCKGVRLLADGTVELKDVCFRVPTVAYSYANNMKPVLLSTDTVFSTFTMDNQGLCSVMTPEQAVLVMQLKMDLVKPSCSQ